MIVSLSSSTTICSTSFLELENTFLEFNFNACSNLRVFEARIENPSYTLDNLMFWLVAVLRTIRSPVFSKLILSLDQTTLEPHVHLLEPAKTALLDQWISWLSYRSGARLVIKGDLLPVWRKLLVLCFPCSAAVSAIGFDFPDPSVAPQCGRTR